VCGIDKSIRFRGLIALDDRSESSIHEAIKYSIIFGLYAKARFYVEQINCYQEFRAPLVDKICDHIVGIMMTANEHVPEVEKNNRTIQERIRSTYHNGPHPTVRHDPKGHATLRSHDMHRAVELFSDKGGISPYYRPHVIFTGRALDFNKHCQFPFGAYVQANNEPNPTTTYHRLCLPSFFPKSKGGT
jgi:hypothetical protein